jgi:hypothetical protein
VKDEKPSGKIIKGNYYKMGKKLQNKQTVDLRNDK